MTTISQLANQLECNGASSDTGVYADQTPISRKPKNSFKAAQILLHNGSVNSAVCIMTAADIVRYGLPAGRFASITRRELPELSDADRNNLEHASFMASFHCDGEIKREFCNG